MSSSHSHSEQWVFPLLLRQPELIPALIAAATLVACGGSSTSGASASVSRVLLISVDGMHQQDVTKCIAANTCPNIAALANTGTTFTNAYTPGDSDSFAGLGALLTGSSPKSTGLFYDVSYDRNLYAPSDVSCAGAKGWNVVFDRGRERFPPSPPSEPGVQFSRDGLSSQMFPHRD
jgi:predicted AlkP superfamily pyrophosphatase or phosphodiesterase